MKTFNPQSASSTRTYQEPERLSKLGQWRRDNPGGLGAVVLDRRAVNK